MRKQTTEEMLVAVGDLSEGAPPDPWQAAQEVVDALVAAGLLGRDPVTRAEVVVVVESEIRRILGVT